MILESAAVGPFFKNGYVVGCERTRQAVFIDPGDEVDQLLAFIAAEELHGHAHPADARARRSRIGRGRSQARARRADPVLHKDDLFIYQNAVRTGMMFGLTVEEPPPVDRLLRRRRRAESRSAITKCVSLHTPGHCPGGVCLAVSKKGDRARRACSSATRCSRDRSAARICRAATTTRCWRRSPACCSSIPTTRSCIQDTGPRRRSAARRRPTPSSWNICSRYEVQVGLSDYRRDRSLPSSPRTCTRPTVSLSPSFSFGLRHFLAVHETCRWCCPDLRARARWSH